MPLVLLLVGLAIAGFGFMFSDNLIGDLCVWIGAVAAAVGIGLMA